MLRLRWEFAHSKLALSQLVTEIICNALNAAFSGAAHCWCHGGAGFYGNGWLSCHSWLFVIGSKQYVHPGHWLLLFSRGLWRYGRCTFCAGSEQQIEEAELCGAAQLSHQRTGSGCAAHQIHVVGQHLVVVAIDELETLSQRIEDALLAAHLQRIADGWLSGMPIEWIVLGHGILWNQSSSCCCLCLCLCLLLFFAKEQIVEIELAGALRAAIVPLAAAIVAGGTALTLRHHWNAILQGWRALLWRTATRAPYAEADVTWLVRVRSHLLALRVELGAHGAAAIPLQALRHALEVLVRVLPIAHFL